MSARSPQTRSQDCAESGIMLVSRMNSVRQTLWAFSLQKPARRNYVFTMFRREATEYARGQFRMDTWRRPIARNDLLRQPLVVGFARQLLQLKLPFAMMECRSTGTLRIGGRNRCPWWDHHFSRIGQGVVVPFRLPTAPGNSADVDISMATQSAPRCARDYRAIAFIICRKIWNTRAPTPCAYQSRASC